MRQIVGARGCKESLCRFYLLYSGVSLLEKVWSLWDKFARGYRTGEDVEGLSVSKLR